MANPLQWFKRRTQKKKDKKKKLEDKILKRSPSTESISIQPDHTANGHRSDDKSSKIETKDEIVQNNSQKITVAVEILPLFDKQKEEILMIIDSKQKAIEKDLQQKSSDTLDSVERFKEDFIKELDRERINFQNIVNQYKEEAITQLKLELEALKRDRTQFEQEKQSWQEKQTRELEKLSSQLSLLQHLEPLFQKEIHNLQQTQQREINKINDRIAEILKENSQLKLELTQARESISHTKTLIENSPVPDTPKVVKELTQARESISYTKTLVENPSIPDTPKVVKESDSNGNKKEGPLTEMENLGT